MCVCVHTDHANAVTCQTHAATLQAQQAPLHLPSQRMHTTGFEPPPSPPPPLQTNSVILTSGTLSPLDSFASELGTAFNIRLEAPHVVDMKKQVRLRGGGIQNRTSWT